MDQPAAGPVINIQPARLADLGSIMELERTGFAPDERWSERSWTGELIAANRRVLIARSYHPVGVITLGVAGELADLHRLVVAPAARRRGIGTQLVAAGLSAVRGLGARAVILEVDYGNDPAIALYQRVGFEQLTVRDDYYGPGRHALILKLYDLAGWPHHDQERTAS
jgi:ribosomal-protein-alanine N-acetyltransferase